MIGEWPRRHTNVPKRRGPRGAGRFYGWWILAMGIVIFAWTAMAQTQGFSVLLLPLTKEMAFGSHDIALIFLVGAFGGAFLMPYVGRLLDRRGARRILIIATLAYASAFGVLALVPSKAAAMGALLAVRLIGSIVLWLGASVLVAWWFSRRRGLALGILVGAGSALLSCLAFGLSVLIEHVGVAGSFLVLATLTLFVITPMVIWGVVDTPEELHQHPDGVPPSATGSQGQPPSVDEGRTGVRASEAYRTPFALVMVAAGSLAAIVTTGYLFHEATIFIEQGATAQDAARSLVPQMVGNAVGILVVSSLVDRRRMRGIVTISMVQLIFTLWWGFNLESFGPLWLFGLSFGLSTGLIFGYVLAALPRYFGTLHLGEIRGTFGAVTMMMASFGPLGFEMLQGVDTSVFIWVAAVAAALISLASLIIPWPEPMEDWTNTSQGPDLARQSSGPSE